MATSPDLAGVVEQTLPDLLPDRLGSGHADGIGRLDLDRSAAAPAADPQQVTVDVAKSLLSSTEFAAELDRASDLALGPTRLVSERSSFPLRRLSAHHYAAQRIALIGDAAHVVHPLAGQGVNLGLLDAAALAQLLAEARGEKEDPGASRVLRQYERWRKSEVALMSTAFDAFDRFLAHGRGPLSRLARRGLGWVNASQELKRLFIARALGTAGELPRVAQRA